MQHSTNMYKGQQIHLRPTRWSCYQSRGTTVRNMSPCAEGNTVLSIVDLDCPPEAKSAIPCGFCAVTRCEVPERQYKVIGVTWKRLVAWREDSKYTLAIDLCLPTAE